jgi:hypothetical protein
MLTLAHRLVQDYHTDYLNCAEVEEKESQDVSTTVVPRISYFSTNSFREFCNRDHNELREDVLHGVSKRGTAGVPFGGEHASNMQSMSDDDDQYTTQRYLAQPRRFRQRDEGLTDDDHARRPKHRRLFLQPMSDDHDHYTRQQNPVQPRRFRRFRQRDEGLTDDDHSRQAKHRKLFLQPNELFSIGSSCQKDGCPRAWSSSLLTMPSGHVIETNLQSERCCDTIGVATGQKPGISDAHAHFALRTEGDNNGAYAQSDDRRQHGAPPAVVLGITTKNVHVLHNTSCTVSGLRDMDERSRPLYPCAKLYQHDRQAQILTLECRMYMLRFAEEMHLEMETIATCALLLFNLAHSPYFVWPDACQTIYTLVDVALFVSDKLHENENARFINMDAQLIAERHRLQSKRDVCNIESAIFKGVGWQLSTPTVIDYVEVMFDNWLYANKQPRQENDTFRLSQIILLQSGVCSMYLCPKFVRTDQYSSAELAVKYLHYALPLITKDDHTREAGDQTPCTAQLPPEFDRRSISAASLPLFESILDAQICM